MCVHIHAQICINIFLCACVCVYIFMYIITAKSLENPETKARKKISPSIA